MVDRQLSGRVATIPNALINEEVLEPQFNYEKKFLLPYYVEIEKVLVDEFVRLDLFTKETGLKVSCELDGLVRSGVFADGADNLSDIAFAIERYVLSKVESGVTNWHLDRSRNDFQACAQLMFGREQMVELAQLIIRLTKSLFKTSECTLETPMPGYTQYQSAQVISPAFYFSAFIEYNLKTLNRLLHTYDTNNLCPLGSGAMAGQEILVDRARMANLLAFNAPVRNALTGVASRDWMLQISSDLANFSVTVSRLVTDLMLWSSDRYHIFTLPDGLSGISSSMPQKRNYPILERIRGKTSHTLTHYIDVAVGQRSTPYTNLVEVSKEAGANFQTLCSNVSLYLRLLCLVLDNVSFNEKKMLDLCKHEYFGGFSLANFLTLKFNIPYRKSQVISGEFITANINNGNAPYEVDTGMLNEICNESGFKVNINPNELVRLFDPYDNLNFKVSDGATSPESVRKVLEAQRKQLDEMTVLWTSRIASLINRPFAVGGLDV